MGNVYGVWKGERLLFAGTMEQVRERYPTVTDEMVEDKSLYDFNPDDSTMYLRLLTEDGNRQPRVWRDIVAWEMRESGATYRQIAKVLNITVHMAEAGVSRTRSGRYEKEQKEEREYWTGTSRSGWSSE